MTHQLTRIATLLTLFFCATITPTTHAQIVSGVVGEIDLKLNPFYDFQIVWSEELGKNITIPDDGISQITPIGFSNISTSIDGQGSFSSQGLSSIDYEYQPLGPAETRFNFHLTAETEYDPDGGGGHAEVGMSFTTDAPFRYRFEADALDVATAYIVTFNGTEAKAVLSQTLGKTGTFPFIFVGDNPLPSDWDTYIDEGILPGGTYDLSIRTYSGFSRSYVPFNSTGTASLHIQLLGDTDLDGTVGMNDLNTVLDSWNQPEPDGPMPADLNGDGYVGIDDLGQVLTAWNSDVRPTATSASVSNAPEPHTTSVMLAYALTLARRRACKA